MIIHNLFARSMNDQEHSDYQSIALANYPRYKSRIDVMYGLFAFNHTNSNLFSLCFDTN